MGFLSKVGGLVKKIDFFYSTEMLRYDKDEDFKTLTGGFISVGIIIAILVGFASMIINTLNQTTISNTTQVIKNPIPTNSSMEITPESAFRFGVEVWRVNLSDTKRYFDVTFSLCRQTNGIIEEVINIPLETCTKQYFAGYPDIVKSFQKLQVGKWLCPPLNTTINLQGKYSSDSYSQYIVTVSACTNSTDPSRPCASPDQIQLFFNERQDFFYFDFYFTNTQINPDQKNYKQYYLEDMSYVIFGSGLGSETFLYFTDYTVSTDYSIWPYSSIAEDKGCMVEDLAVNHNFQTNINGTFVTFYLAKSSNSIIYTREVQKASAVFSFIGGMIGAISAVFFIVKVYTNVAFEFSISFELFKRDRKNNHHNKEAGDEPGKEGEKAKEVPGGEEVVKHLEMNFMNFIKYYFYLFTKMIGKPCDWPVMEYAEECKREISKQLDVKVLLKRIIFIEYCLTYLMEDYHLNALQMQKPLSPGSIKKIREKCESIIEKDGSSSSSDSDINEAFKSYLNIHDDIEPLPATKEEPSPAVLMSPIQIKSKNILKKHRCSMEDKIQNADFTRKIVVIDIESSQFSESGAENSEIRETINGMKPKQTRKIAKDKRSSYLLDLHKSAMEGNTLSFRIWNQLDKKTRKQIEEGEGGD